MWRLLVRCQLEKANGIIELRNLKIILSWGCFFAVDIQNYEGYSNFGGVEPGNTHLSILSMTGLVGIILYLLVLIVAYKKV